MTIKRMLILLTGLMAVAVCHAQFGDFGKRMGGGQGSRSSGKTGSYYNSNKSEKKTVYPPGQAWTLSYPLGLRFESTIDTLMLNYQRQAIPSLVTDAQALTGNYGTEGQTQLWFKRPMRSDFFFVDALDAWLPSASTQKVYNVYQPMTLASYNFGGGKDTNQDRLRAMLAGNVNRRIGLNASIDYLYSKGSYENQAVKQLSYGLAGYYTGDRYEAQAYFYQFNSLNKENGGITDDLYITDPAQLQGGVSKIDAKSIPTNLSAAHNRVKGKQFYMSHAYNVGYWKDVQVNDTLTREEYVPMLKFIYSMDYHQNSRMFRNDNVTEGNKFWGDTHYLTNGNTLDKMSWWGLSNTFGIQMIEGFRKWVKFGLNAYATYETRHFTQANKGWIPPTATDPEGNETPVELTPLPDGIVINPKESQNLLWIGGQLTKQQGTTLRYDADVKFGLLGDVAGDLDIKGNGAANIRLLSDTVTVSANVRFRNLAQPSFLKQYISNRFAWKNDFGKTRGFRVGGRLDIPWTNTSLAVNWENVQNHVYFNTAGLPVQHGGSVHILAASLEQRLKFGIWNWDNTITFQTSSNQNVIPLPALAIYSNMYLHFNAFKVLQLQIGVDCDYYTRYRGVNYEPATMTFRVGDDWRIGNFPFMDVYVTAKLYKVRFFVLFSHFNQGWFTKEFFSMPHYPVNPRRLQFGLSVDFPE